MTRVWVQAITACNYELNGIQMRANPGDWFEAGKGDARRWLAEGKVAIPDLRKKLAVQELADCGISLRGPNPGPVAEALRQQFPGLEVAGGLGLTHPRCLLWDVSARLRTELIPTGLGLLQAWHLAVPLLDYDTLARDIGGEADRQLTAGALHDLRVPVYDVRVVFARKCRDAEDLLAAWQEEKAGGGDERLAFLRALHRVVPLVNALPPTWVR